MAYMDQKRKAERVPAIKAIFKKYAVKSSISVNNHSSLVVTVKSGKLDFIGAKNKHIARNGELHGRDDIPVLLGSFRVNPYYDADNMRSVECNDIADFLDALTTAMYGSDYFNDSDAQTDYFHCSHYININIGNWDKPYILTV